jgi:SAM-dependent methyltransferase
MNNWYETWFDSPYYHILYKNRNDNEAKQFLDNLTSFLKPLPGSKILDLACGRGRHSIYLNKKGFEVTGIDLSQESIKHNHQFENETLSFFVHDMRKEFRVNYYDYIFNLFTSFGYFNKEKDNEDVIRSAGKGLKPNGVFVLDYLNVSKALSELKAHETKIIEGIEFHIYRFIENDFIVKQISFNHGDQSFTFHEKVKMLNLENFEKYFKLSQLKILNLFGNYSLKDFNVNTSERLIMVAQKNK